MLKRLNAVQYNWLFIPSFATVALIARPFSGKLSDNVGRVFVMATGALVTSIAGVFYLFVPFVSLFFANRAIHGLCAGFTPTGFTAYADDIVPIEKRGEAMGIVGICNNLGNAIGWMIGSECSRVFGLDTMLMISVGLGLTSFVIFSSLKESISNKKKFSLEILKLRKNELFEKRVWLPGIVLLLTAYASGAILSTIGDFSLYIHIKNKGLYMAIYILSSLFIRFMAGRWSEKYGRSKISLYGAIALTVSMILLSYADGIVLYSASSVMFGVGFGLLSPALFAWAVDLSLPGLKGKAVGTMFIYLETGVILGSSATGLIYNSISGNFPMAFGISGVVVLLAVIILLFAVLGNKKKRITEHI